MVFIGWSILLIVIVTSSQIYGQNEDEPQPHVLEEFSRLAHDLRSGNITILDTKTFFIPKLYYDGLGPDAYFWVGTGAVPSTKQTKGIKVPNEKGSLDPLPKYTGQNITIRLPGKLTMDKIDWLAMWCVQFKHNFGYVLIPKNLNVPVSNYTDDHSDTYYTGKGETNEPKVMSRSGFVEEEHLKSGATTALITAMSIVMTGILLVLNK